MEFPCYDFCGSDIMYQETQEQPPCFRKNLVGSKGQEYSGGGRRNLRGYQRKKKTVPVRVSGIPKKVIQEYIIMGLLSPCYFFLCGEMNQCLWGFFCFLCFPTEFQSILLGSALAEAWDSSTSEKHINYSEAQSMIKQFHPPNQRMCLSIESKRGTHPLLDEDFLRAKNRSSSDQTSTVLPLSRVCVSGGLFSSSPTYLGMTPPLLLLLI